ncbi:N-(5'-phosphoribosyl)anthranilate isomerase [Planktotalea sp.]|uniref:N-(5'-phosphoribosyl)anthranilate isomerase n=1 Tax=Planktotalea sp. TaxID=2029877 RepID=UPI003D6C120C
MTRVFRISSAAPWQDQIFGAKSTIVRRSVKSIEQEIGRDALELEVRKRGFHMIEAAGQIIIICTPEPLRIIC